MILPPTTKSQPIVLPVIAVAVPAVPAAVVVAVVVVDIGASIEVITAVLENDPARKRVSIRITEGASTQSKGTVSTQSIDAASILMTESVGEVSPSPPIRTPLALMARKVLVEV